MRAELTDVKRSGVGDRDARLTIRRGGRDMRGALAAWAADRSPLGEGDEVWPALERAMRRGDIRGQTPAMSAPDGSRRTGSGERSGMERVDRRRRSPARSATRS